MAEQTSKQDNFNNQAETGDSTPSFQTPASVQEAYEQAYYEAAGEVPPVSTQPFSDPNVPSGVPQEQSFVDYVKTDAFQQAAQAAQQGSASQASQQGAGNAYQQPWNSGTAQQYQQAYQQGYQQSYQQSYAGQYYTQQGYVKTKDHVAAGLLAIFLGMFGVHKFYLGYNNAGFIMLGVSILGSLFTFGLAGLAMQVVGIIEGIIYLTKNQSIFDAEYVYGKKEWF